MSVRHIRKAKFIDGNDKIDIIELGGGGMIDNREASGLRKSPFIELTDEEFVGTKESLSTVTVLVKNQKRTKALFFGHLALEKMLKALCAVRNEAKDSSFTNH